MHVGFIQTDQQHTYFSVVIILQVVRASRFAVYRRTAIETNGFFRKSEAYKQRTGSARTRKIKALCLICANVILRFTFYSVYISVY